MWTNTPSTRSLFNIALHIPYGQIWTAPYQRPCRFSSGITGGGACDHGCHKPAAIRTLQLIVDNYWLVCD